ncbi:MAG: hypothetical protein WC455_24200 [Dehalococcoidia bacterium]|jgi:hypothetical protein
MQKVKIENMLSDKTGREVPNQFKIFTDEGVYFQSYSSVIAFKPLNGPLQLDRDKWDYSRTTAKYRNAFTRLTTKETEKQIEAGQILLVDLN